MFFAPNRHVGLITSCLPDPYRLYWLVLKCVSNYPCQRVYKKQTTIFLTAIFTIIFIMFLCFGGKKNFRNKIFDKFTPIFVSLFFFIQVLLLLLLLVFRFSLIVTAYIFSIGVAPLLFALDHSHLANLLFPSVCCIIRWHKNAVCHLRAQLNLYRYGVYRDK